MKSALQVLREIRARDDGGRTVGEHSDAPDHGDPRGDDARGLEHGDVLEARQDWIAVRLYSKLLDRDLWLCRDQRAADELSAEFPRVPVLTFDEVPLLAGKTKEQLRAMLDVKAEFPDAGLIQ